MIALQPIHTEHALYLFVEKLLHSAFPSDERRDDEQQRAYTDGNNKFRCLLIRDFAMRTFLQDMDRPVVLEVEMPRVKGDITHRRIAFYRRQGFSLKRMPYRQPPYRTGDKWLPMKLMSYGKVKWLRIAELVRDTIYSEVYGV